MTLFSLLLSSSSRCFPKSSVPFLRLRPPPAPPSEPPAPPTPPKPPDPPDPHICASSREARAQPLSFHHLNSLHRVHIDSKPPSLSPSRSVSPCRKSIPMSTAALARRLSRSRHLHHLLCSSKVNLGFYYLGQIWMGGLLGQKWRAFLLGPINPTPNPLFSIYRNLSCLVSFSRLQPSHAHRITPSHLLRFAGKVASLFLQVCSYYSFYYSSTLRIYWMVVVSVALALWNLGITITPLMILDTLCSNIMLSGGILIALVRNFTAVCRFSLESTLLEVALMPLFNLRLPLPQYEAVKISISLKLLLPHHEAGMILIKFRLPLPQYEDLLQKLWPRSLCDIVSLVWFLEKLSWFMEKTLYVLTKNNLGSWTPDLFIEKWWFSQLHTSPNLRFSSHLVGSVNWCFVAYICVAVFQDACSLLDAASLLSSGSPRVLSYCQSLISRFSTIVGFNFSCLSVMYDSICFFHVFCLAFVAAVCLAIVAHLLYLLNSFSIVGE